MYCLNIESIRNGVYNQGMLLCCISLGVSSAWKVSRASDNAVLPGMGTSINMLLTAMYSTCVVYIDLQSIKENSPRANRR